MKCIAAAAPFVASGGADDTVHVYNAQVLLQLGNAIMTAAAPEQQLQDLADRSACTCRPALTWGS